MKIQCACGAKYAFDVTPEMLQNPVRFVCPSCGRDSSDFVNELIRRELGGQTPAAPAPATASPRLKISHDKPQPAAPQKTAGIAAGARTLRKASPRTGRGPLRGLREADVPAMHEIVRARLFAAVPGKGRCAKHPCPGVMPANPPWPTRGIGGRPAPSAV